MHATFLASGTDRATWLAAVVAFPVAGVALAFGPNIRILHQIPVVAAVWFVALWSSYGEPRLAGRGTTVIAGTGTLTGLAMLSLLLFWLPSFRLSTTELLLMAGGVFAMASIVGARADRLASRRRLLLVGADEGINGLLRELSQHPHLPFAVVGVIAEQSADTISGVRRLGEVRELQAVLREEQPDLVVLGGEPSRTEALAQVLEIGASLDVRVMDVHHLYEHAFGKVPVQHLSPAWFMSVLHLYRSPYSRVAKRTFDIVVAGIVLVFVAPLLVAVALLVRASSPGPALFRQLRLGEGGRTFSICKFRTMVVGAEAQGGAVWAAVDDARITAVGGVLRRMRIDELPQLWNVLRGDMSIVGPRPERPEFLELLRQTVPFWTRRNLVKPGITGWAQVCHGYTADAMATADKLAYDLYYLKYRSLLFDVAIALRTVGIILTGFGSR